MSACHLPVTDLVQELGGEADAKLGGGDGDASLAVARPAIVFLHLKGKMNTVVCTSRALVYPKGDTRGG
jgi:hypothetical protein